MSSPTDAAGRGGRGVDVLGPALALDPERIALWAGTRAPVDLFLHLSGTTTYPLA